MSTNTLKLKSPGTQAALERLRSSPGEWVSPPEPHRIGRKASRPWIAYEALVRMGLAEKDSNGRYRVASGDVECFQCGAMHDSFGIMPICEMCTRAHAAALSPTRLESIRLQALDAVRVMLAQEEGPAARRIETMIARNYGIKPLQACAGEAHANPHIDHCGLCAPRWGWVES